MGYQKGRALDFVLTLASSMSAGEHHLRLLRMRASADLEGIEVGPELGRGSYGRVYKGAHRGPDARTGLLICSPVR